MVSSSNFPFEIVFTKVVLPAFYKPIIEISSSFLKNYSLIQEIKLLNIAYMFLLMFKYNVIELLNIKLK